MAANPITKISPEEYLELERAAEFRSEYFYGEIVAMAGGSPRHAIISGNIFGNLFMALQGSECAPFNSDLRVQVSSQMYVYPDVTIVCGKLLLADKRQDNLLNPKVIFEVLSPSTEKYDRVVKFRHYREIESLTDYILVDQDQMRIEQYTRGDVHTWTLHDYQLATDILAIPSINVSLPLAAIYNRVDFAAE